MGNKLIAYYIKDNFSEIMVYPIPLVPSRCIGVHPQNFSGYVRLNKGVGHKAKISFFLEEFALYFRKKQRGEHKIMFNNIRTNLD